MALNNNFFDVVPLQVTFFRKLKDIAEKRKKFTKLDEWVAEWKKLGIKLDKWDLSGLFNWKRWITEERLKNIAIVAWVTDEEYENLKKEARIEALKFYWIDIEKLKKSSQLDDFNLLDGLDLDIDLIKELFPKLSPWDKDELKSEIEFLIKMKMAKKDNKFN